jgi:hypothetical protein
VIVDIVLLQHSSPVVVEINTDLFTAVYSVVSQYRVATCGDPNSGQCVGVNLISLDKTSAIVVLCVNENMNKNLIWTIHTYTIKRVFLIL